MESNQTHTDIINQQNIKIQQLENLLKIQHITNNEQENICLYCNQLFTTLDIFNHSQQNKDHIDHCIHIDSIKSQLLDINNINSDNNNNIFKKRLNTLWYSLKRLSTTHSSLNSKINEIRNHFKIFYDYLMSKEHSLKKQIQDDIDIINNDIIHQINEFKSIINIVNLNNNISSKVKNSNCDLVSDQSDFEDLTSNYTISSIIESIQQSKSYNNFIENNKNTLFYNNYFKLNNNNFSFLYFIENHNRNFNSSLLKPTKINSTRIDEYKHIVKVKQHDLVCYQLQKIIDESIILNESPSALVRFGDLEGIKLYYKRNNISKLEYSHKSKSKEQKEIKHTIIEILKSNRIDILEYLFQELHFDIKTQFNPKSKILNLIDSIDMLTFSAMYSNLETIQFIESFGIKNNIKWKYDICLELSPISNNIKVLQYFSKKVIGMIDFLVNFRINNIYVSHYAALLGHIDMIEWISRNTPFLFRIQDKSYNFVAIIFAMKYVMDNPTKYEHLEKIKWIHRNRSEGCTAYAMDWAAWSGHLETVKWLHHNRTEGCSTWAIDVAAKGGHLETIKWLHHNRSEGCTTDAMDYAASNGHLETIKWLHHNRTEGCTRNAMDYAAQNGHLETIKWLHYNRTEGCTRNAMDYAAQNGHLETIKWLHHNRTEGCTTDAMDNATRNGHLEIINWLHENRTEGCTTNEKLNSKINKDSIVLEWLISFKKNK